MAALNTRIRSLRRQQQRTLKDVADRCGFTVSLLSKIESGKTSPPVATLTKIANALGVKMASLLHDSHDHATVFTPSSRLHKQPASMTDKGYAFYLLASERTDKLMQPFLFEAKRGKIVAGSMNHSGEEFIYVLEGSMQYQVGEITYTLGPGDSLYFNAEENHDLTPLSKTVRYMAIFTERRMLNRTKSS